MTAAGLIYQTRQDFKVLCD